MLRVVKYSNKKILKQYYTDKFTPEWCVIGPMSDPAYSLQENEAIHYFLSEKEKCICGKESRPHGNDINIPFDLRPGDLADLVDTGE